MSYLTNVKKMYMIIFFRNLIFAYVIERLFWEQRGMTVLYVVYTEIIYAATVMLFEIPTGIIADKWSRKKILVVSAGIHWLAFLIVIFANSFWHFAGMVFLAGIASAMDSGSRNSLLYDSLKMVGQESSFNKIIGRLTAVDFSAAMIAALSGAFLASRYGYEFNYRLSLISLTITLLATLALTDTEQPAKLQEPIALKDYVFKSLKVFKNNKALCLAVVSGMFLGATIVYLDEFWQIYLNRLEVPITFYGMFLAVSLLGKIPGSLIAARLSERFRLQQLLSANILIYTAGFLLMAIVRSPIGIIASLLVNLGSGITEPLVTSYLHHRIDSQIRATIDSFQSLGLRCVTIAVGLGFGFVSTRYSIFCGFGLFALLAGVYLVFFTIMTKKTRL